LVLVKDEIFSPDKKAWTKMPAQNVEVPAIDNTKWTKMLAQNVEAPAIDNTKVNLK